MREAFTREQLYELLWSEPAQAIAKRYGVSDVAIKKRIPDDIPWPPRGYWQKSGAGRIALKPPLPPRGPGATNTIYLGSGRPDHEADFQRKLDELPDEPPSFPEPISQVRARLETTFKGARAARDLRDPDPSLKWLLEKEARKAEKLSQSKWAFVKPLFDGQFEQRRLRIICGLGRGLSAFGSFKLDSDTGRSLTFQTTGAKLVVELDHPKAKTDRTGQPQIYGGPAGPLRLKIGEPELARGYRFKWIDDEMGKLEAKLPSIALDILLAAEVQLRADANKQYSRLWVARNRRDELREQQRLEAERIARGRIEEAERRRRQVLLDQASNWRNANDIRALVVAARAKSDGGALEAWASWALAEADKLDPLVSGALERSSQELLV